MGNTSHAGPAKAYQRLYSDFVFDCHMHVMNGNVTPLPMLPLQPGFAKVSTGLSRQAVNEASRLGLLIIRDEPEPVEIDNAAIRFLKKFACDPLLNIPKTGAKFFTRNAEWFAESAVELINIIGRADIHNVVPFLIGTISRGAVYNNIAVVSDMVFGADGTTKKSVQEQSIEKNANQAIALNSEVFSVKQIGKDTQHATAFDKLWAANPPTTNATEIEWFKPLQTALVALPMDMEYAHLLGYMRDDKNLPMQIYFTKKTKLFGLIPVDTLFWRRYNEKKPAIPDEIRVSGEKKNKFVTWEKQFTQTVAAAKKNPWKIMPFFHYEPRRWCFQDTDSIIEPITQAYGKWSTPFSHLISRKIAGTTGSGFIGMKIYPQLGYNPGDFLRLPHLKDFYSKCIDEEIPILAHCSRGGLVTHDYIHFVKEARRNNRFYYPDQSAYETDKDFALFSEEVCEALTVFFTAIEPRYNNIINNREYKQIVSEICSRHPAAVANIKIRHNLSSSATQDQVLEAVAEDYQDFDLINRAKAAPFEELTGHPFQWRKVLDSTVTTSAGRTTPLKNLKLCLAHFGGDQWKKEKGGMENPWIKEIISMLESRSYPNLYTDISCFLVKEPGKKDDNQAEFIKFLQKYKNSPVLEKILFGTDWYLINFQKVANGASLKYSEFCTNIKAMCDSVDANIWVRFTMMNPVRYLGLDSQIIIDNFSLYYSGFGNGISNQKGYSRFSSLKKEYDLNRAKL